MRKAVTLADYMCARWPSMSLLVVASSPAVLGLNWPEDVELVKLPYMTRVGPDGLDEPFASPTLPISPRELRALRREILLSIVRHFPPDLLLVDFMPAGQRGELLPALRHLKANSPCTRLVLGLRDIMYDAAQLRLAWSRDGAYDVLDTLYDRILVCGQRDIYDLAAEAGLSPRAAAKVRYVGYLRRQATLGSPEQVRASLGLQTERLVLVTVGGGAAGGERVLQCMLEALRQAPEPLGFDCVLVGGPLLPAADRQRLKALLPVGAPVRFLDAVPDLTPYIATADVVVARAGYNTVCEILSLARPALLVPLVAFVGAQASREQLLRAEALQRRGLAHTIHPDDLTPGRLLAEVLSLLERPISVPEVLNLNGLPAVASELEALLAPSIR